MKNVYKFLAVTALAALIGLSVTCSNGSTDSNTETWTGKSAKGTFTLKVTGNNRAIDGDNYELKVSGSVSKTSKGTIASVSGDDFSLRPSNSATTFTATVSSAGLTGLSGTITWTDGSSNALSNEVLTPTGYSGSGGGKFTVTGIPSQHEGRYAYFCGVAGSKVLYGWEGISGSGSGAVARLSKISGGSVSLPMFVADTGNGTYKKYSGSDTAMWGGLIILDDPTYVPSVDIAVVTDIAMTGGAASFMNVKFSKGSASKSWSESLTGGY